MTYKYFSTPPTVPVDLDYGHANYWAGRKDGYNLGQLEASEDMARGWLHNLAREFTGYAAHNAGAKGPHWQQAILEAAGGAE